MSTNWKFTRPDSELARHAKRQRAVKTTANRKAFARALREQAGAAPPQLADAADSEVTCMECGQVHAIDAEDLDDLQAGSLQCANCGAPLGILNDDAGLDDDVAADDAVEGDEGGGDADALEDISAKELPSRCTSTGKPRNVLLRQWARQLREQQRRRRSSKPVL
jgi:hypothetical protein